MEILGGRGRRQHRRASWWPLVLLMVLPAGLFGQAADEYEVKAAFLFNLTKFVEWPPADSPAFAICILGDDPFGSALDQLVKGKTAYGHPIQVRRLKEPAEAKQCQVVFVRREEKDKASKLMDTVRGAPILTVGENREFAATGGMIYLPMKDNRVAIVINAPAAEKAGLKISARLLSLAKSYKDDAGDER